MWYYTTYKNSTAYNMFKFYESFISAIFFFRYKNLKIKFYPGIPDRTLLNKSSLPYEISWMYFLRLNTSDIC